MEEEFKWWYERVFCQSPRMCKLQYDDEKMWEAWKAGHNLPRSPDTVLVRQDQLIAMQEEIKRLKGEIALWKLAKADQDMELKDEAN